MLGLASPWLIAGALAASLAAGVTGWRLGADRVQARWDRAELERQREAGRQRAAQVDRSIEAGAQLERERVAINRRLAEARRELAAGLGAPVPCPAASAPPLRLGDVVVPAAVLDGLRRAAGGGADPPRPAASQPGR